MTFTSAVPVPIRFHQVKINEDIVCIAEKYKLTPAEIQKQNPNAKMTEGEILVIAQ